MKQFEFDLAKAFTPMPMEFHEAIEFAFERGEMEMKKRHKIMTLLSVAAALAIVFSMAALAVNHAAPQMDSVVLSAGGNTAQPRLVEDGPTHVYAIEPALNLAEETAAPVSTSSPVLVKESEDTESENTETVVQDEDDDGHFYDGNFTDPQALYILLGNAYYTHLQINGLIPHSHLVLTAAEELKNIPSNFPGEAAQWSAPIRETLRSVLGFSEDFISAHYLVNDVIACLCAAAEIGLGEIPEEAAYAMPEPTAEPLLEPGEIVYMETYPVLAQGESNAAAD